MKKTVSKLLTVFFLFAEILFKSNSRVVDICCRINSDKSVMPRFISIARDFCLVLGIAKNKSELVRVVLKPFKFGSFSKAYVVGVVWSFASIVPKV